MGLKQMIECVDFLHSKDVVHFDISLENWLINDVKVAIDGKNAETTNIHFLTDTIQIKLCDFGLAQKFTKSECLSSKWSGKKQYKSPEVISKKRCFDAKSNDIWCVGMCLFMLAAGVPPWFVAHTSDKLYSFVLKNSILDLIKKWNLLNYVDTNLIHLFDAIFQSEENRVNSNYIKQYIFFTASCVDE